MFFARPYMAAGIGFPYYGGFGSFGYPWGNPYYGYGCYPYYC